jgi:preprotein translocase subunit SecG
MLQTLVLLAHLVVATLIIVLVLLQRGKGAEAGTGFGAGASGTVFGARGSSSFFSRTTALLATLFFATSLALAYFASQVSGPESVLEGSVIEDLEPGSEPTVTPVVPELPELETTPASELPELNVEESPDQGAPEN